MKIARYFFIRRNVCKTKNEVFCITIQSIGDMSDFFKQSIYIYFVSKNKRVKTPYDRSNAETINEATEGFYPLLQRRYIWFQPFSLVIIKGKLYIAAYPPFFKYRQIW